jgi:hypothetical protein
VADLPIRQDVFRKYVKAPRMPQKPRSFWEGVNDPIMPSGLMGLLGATPEDSAVGFDEQQRASRRGLLDMGLAILSGSQQKVGGGLGPALQEGLSAGREGYRGALDTAQGQVMQRRMRELYEQVKPQPGESVEQVFERVNALLPQALALGPEAAKPLVTYLASLGPSLQQNQQQQKRHLAERTVADPKTGLPVVQTYDSSTGEVIDSQPGVAKNEGSARQDIEHMRGFQRENQLGDDYRMATKDHATVANQITTLTRNADIAKTNPAASIGLIFSFMKIQDPGSTVREGEYATAQNAAGVPDRIRNMYNKALDGQFLTPQQVENFRAAGLAVGRGWKQKQDQLRTSYGQRARRWGVDPEIFVDYYSDLGLDAAPSSAPALEGPPAAPAAAPAQRPAFSPKAQEAIERYKARMQGGRP